MKKNVVYNTKWGASSQTSSTQREYINGQFYILLFQPQRWVHQKHAIKCFN